MIELECCDGDPADVQLEVSAKCEGWPETSLQRLEKYKKAVSLNKVDTYDVRCATLDQLVAV